MKYILPIAIFATLAYCGYWLYQAELSHDRLDKSKDDLLNTYRVNEGVLKVQIAILKTNWEVRDSIHTVKQTPLKIDIKRLKSKVDWSTYNPYDFQMDGRHHVVDLEFTGNAPKKMRVKLHGREFNLPQDVDIRDSIIWKQDTLITDLEDQVKGDSASFVQVSKLWEERLQISEDLKSIILKDNARLSKQSRKKFSLGVGAGYGVSKDGLGPVISVGIQYSLWRF